MLEQYQTIKYQQEPGLVAITLNRPDRLNALDRQLLKELADALERVEEDGGVRVITLTGEGRAFCAGADIKERVEHIEDMKVQRQSLLVSRVARRLETIPAVVVGAVNGVAAGGGFELALACDLLVASSEARFALPEVRLGLMPGGGGTVRLPKAVGLVRARGMMLFGDFIDAQQALEWGLVNRVVAPEKVMEEARAMAQALLAQAPLALQMIKAAVNYGAQMDTESALEHEQRCSHLLALSEDRKEGQRAFVEKRPPRFQGR